MEKHGRIAYACLFITLLLIWQVGGGLLMLSFDAFFPEQGLAEAFISVNIPHLVLFAASLFAVKVLFHDEIRDRKHSFSAYAAVAILTLFITALSQLFHLKEMTGSGHTVREWLMMLFLTLIITPLQSAAEELLFRLVPYRIIVRKRSVKSTLAAALFSGFLFLLLHMAANSEFRATSSPWLYAYYFLFGFLAMVLTAYTQDIICPVIIHSVSNVFVLTVAGYSASPLQGAPLFMTEGVPSPFLSTLTLTAVFTAVFIYFIGAENAKEKEKTE